MNVVTWLRSEWDRVVGFTLAAVGGVLVVVGGLAARGAPTTLDALSYIATAGLIGLFCLGLGVGLFLSADLRDEWHKLDRIEAAIRGEPVRDAEEVLDLVRQNCDSGGSAAGGRLPAAVGSASAGESRRGGGRTGLTTAVALDSRPAVLVLLVLLAPLAVLSIGVSRASQAGQFTTSAGGVWVAALAVVVLFALVGFDTGRLRSRVIRRQAAVLGRYRVADTAHIEDASTPRPAHPGVWVADGLRHFHRAGCPALAGLKAKPVASDAVAPELVACGLCGIGG